MPQLIVKRSGKLVRRFSFQSDIITIGRDNLESSDRPDLALADRSRRVSRYHATIILDRKGKYFIRDLASANGTYVNGRLVHGHYLNESDRITLGNFEIFYSENQQAPVDLSQAIRVVSASPTVRGSDRKTYLDAIPDDFPSDLPESMQQTLHDIIHRLRSLPAGPGFYEEILHCIIPAFSARRGLVARCGSAETVVPLALCGIDIEQGEQMRVSAEYIGAAQSGKGPVNAFFAGKAVLCAMLDIGSTESGLMYLEKERGESFTEEEELFLELLCARIGKLSDKALAIDVASQIDEVERFEWKVEMVAKSPIMRPIVAEIEAACDIDSNILLRGETGTGKEITAQAIHAGSARADHPFVVVELSNLEKEIVSGTLFGWVKGAYTGADLGKAGAFEMADGGSIFLDEIGDVSLDVQVKLRRAVEEKEVSPVGSAAPVKVDVKVQAATNVDLDRATEDGAFREDLLQRFGKWITLPPLRERKTDIPLLVCFFIDKSEPPLLAISHGAMRLLMDYDWPGNIRELREVVKDLAARGKEYIFSFDLPKRFYAAYGEKGGKKSPTLQKTEKQEIIRVLNHVGWNKTRAARMLGFGSKQTIYNKIKKYDITDPRKKPEDDK